MSNDKIIVNISIRDKRAIGDGTVFVCDNSDYVIRFDFDEEWDGKDLKTARLIYGSNFIDLPFSGNEVEIERTPVSSKYSIGVYAGDIKTSTPAVFDCYYSILSSNPTHKPPAEDVYNKIMELINGIDNAIIDVDILPTENILDNVFYQVQGKIYYRFGDKWVELATELFDGVSRKEFESEIKKLSDDISELDETVGDIDSALDGILAIQNGLIGGEGV